MANSILIIDDDTDYLNSLKRALIAKGFQDKILISASEDEGLKIFKRENPLVVILDLELNPKKGTESGYMLLQKILSEDKTCKVLVLTGHSGLEFGIKAIKLGASNFLRKPANIDHLMVLLDDAKMQALMLREYELLKSKDSENEINNFIIGDSDAIKKVRDEILFLSQNSTPLLIQGETGTGKGLAAKALHLFGKYKKFPFIRYQPNFLSNDLVNSDLFGHKKGSFTGANDDKKGLLELAANGTFFLDEVCLLPLDVQITLLTTLQEHKIRKVGDTKEIDVNFRLVCASNENIETAIQEKRFRLDFYHRIAYANIVLPPLRNRKEDIKPLSLFFIRELCKKEDLLVQDISDAAIEKLKSNSLKGNIRELQSIIEVSAYKANYENRRVIEEKDILFSNVTQNSFNSESLKGNNFLFDSPLPFKDKVKLFKSELVKYELNKNDQNQSLTAKKLGIDRSTLIRLMEE